MIVAGGWMHTLMSIVTGPSLSALQDCRKNIAAQIGELESAIQSTTEYQANDSLGPCAARMTADMASVEASILSSLFWLRLCSHRIELVLRRKA